MWILSGQTQINEKKRENKKIKKEKRKNIKINKKRKKKSFTFAFTPLLENKFFTSVIKDF